MKSSKTDDCSSIYANNKRPVSESEEFNACLSRGQKLLQHAIQMKLPNDATCAILQKNLDECRKFTIHQANKLTESYQELYSCLHRENLQVENWKSSLKDPACYNIKAAQCHGEYEECKSSEVSEQDLIDLRTSRRKSENVPASYSNNAAASTSRNLSSQLNPRFQKSDLPTNDLEKVFRRPDSKNAQNQDLVTQNTNNKSSKNDFRTALSEYNTNQLHKRTLPQTSSTSADTLPAPCYGASRKSLGGRRVAGKFIPPMLQLQKPEDESQESVEEVDDRLKQIDPKMVELIKNEIMSHSTPIGWDDIAGLQYAKTIIQEAVVLPILRPDIFTGLRRPPRGILLFGPPGTGKTLLGKCIASQSRSTFFSISASSLTSKWIGDGEKMVRALFAVASVYQPAVIFIDEIDSLLCQRSETEHESSRRLKTEFLIQLDGVGTGEDDRILIVGATNRPQELDEAARRRLVKRLYIPLPELEARIQILKNLIKNERHSLNSAAIQRIGEMTEGYSGADMKTLCHEASMGPIRSIPFDQMTSIDRDDVRPLMAEDFVQALKRVRASVSSNDLIHYIKWDETYGSGGMQF